MPVVAILRPLMHTDIEDTLAAICPHCGRITPFIPAAMMNWGECPNCGQRFDTDLKAMQTIWNPRTP